jgi:hypothetical protein
MQLLGDLGHVESHFRLDTVLVSVQERCMVWAKRTIGSEKSFWTHPMELLGDMGHVESRFGPFGDSVSVSAR